MLSVSPSVAAAQGWKCRCHGRHESSWAAGRGFVSKSKYKSTEIGNNESSRPFTQTERGIRFARQGVENDGLSMNQRIE